MAGETFDSSLPCSAGLFHNAAVLFVCLFLAIQAYVSEPLTHTPVNKYQQICIYWFTKLIQLLQLLLWSFIGSLSE